MASEKSAHSTGDPKEAAVSGRERVALFNDTYLPLAIADVKRRCDEVGFSVLWPKIEEEIEENLERKKQKIVERQEYYALHVDREAILATLKKEAYDLVYRSVQQVLITIGKMAEGFKKENGGAPHLHDLMEEESDRNYNAAS